MWFAGSQKERATEARCLISSDVICFRSSGGNRCTGTEILAKFGSADIWSVPCYSARRPNDQRAKLVVAPGWIQTEMGGSDATFTVEECIPLVADLPEKSHGKPGLRYVDRFDNTLPW